MKKPKNNREFNWGYEAALEDVRKLVNKRENQLMKIKCDENPNACSVCSMLYENNLIKEQINKLEKGK